MGVLEGLLGGFVGRKYDVEAQNRKDDAAQQQKELSVFQALASADDPEVRALALTGILHSAEPRKKKSGLRGWIGEMEQSPYLGQMRNLLATPVTEANPLAGDHPPLPPGVTATLPSTQTTQGMGMPAVKPSLLETPDAGAPAAQPSTSLVEQKGQGAPPTPVSLSTAAPPVPYTVTHPRAAFMGPLERFSAEAVAKAGADVEGDIAAWMKMGLSRAQAIEQVRQERLRKGTGGAFKPQSVAGEVPNGQGGWEPAYGIFDPVNKHYISADTGQPLPGFRPRTTVASTSMGADRNSVAIELGYGQAARITDPAQMAHVNAVLLQRQGILKPSQAITAAHSMLPNGTLEQQMEVADALMAGTKIQPLSGSAPNSAGLLTAPPAQTPTTGTTPPPAPGQPPASIAAPPTQTPAPTATPPPAPQGGLRNALPPTLASADKTTGAPLPPAVATTLAKAKSTNDLIDQALAALEPYKNDNTLEGSIKLAHDYRLGYDSVGNAAAQLADLAGLQSSAQSSLTGGSTRAVRFYVDRRQHVPRLPSGRQVLIAQGGGMIPGIGANATQVGSQLLKGDEGGFDSPASMYQKLQNAKANNQSFISEIESSVREPMKMVPAHTPATGTTPPPAVGKPYQDASGAWIIP